MPLDAILLSDDAMSSLGRFAVTEDPAEIGKFKTPSLRNVALTAPYAHDGQLATLDDVVRHYSELNLDRLHADGEQILKPLHLSEGERADLVAFLRSLSDPKATMWQPRRLPACELRLNAPN